MQTYIINMDTATDRWQFVKEAYAKTGIPFTRVSGIWGKNIPLPHPAYDEAKYRRCHGQHTNPGTLGCYLSHLRCLELFLESGDEFAMIAEDDSKPNLQIDRILHSAIRYRECWDILRVCGFHHPHPVAYAEIEGGYQLAVCFTKLCGTGAYVVSRHAADVLLQKLVPMFLPIDHALDREWAYGLRASAIMPLPISQEEHTFTTQIPISKSYKLPAIQRYWTVFPFRLQNELRRLVARSRQLRKARAIVRRMDRKSDPVQIRHRAAA